MITVFGPKTTLEELRKIEPVVPEGAGKRWAPIRHDELVENILMETDKRNWKVWDQVYSTMYDGAVMAGALLLEDIPTIPSMPGIQLAIGFLNDNRRVRALHLTVGAHICCCCNGMCTGEIILNRVHDKTVNLPSEVSGAVDRYIQSAAHIPASVNAMREHELSPGDSSEILMEAGRRGLVGWAMLGRVDEEYRNPTFAEHGKGTSWALLNAFTYKVRDRIAPVNQMWTYNEFRRLLPGGADLN